MIVLPAIDMLQGKCVRLVKGDYGTAEQMTEDIKETACMFEQAGAHWLHMVDLDGAKEKRRVNHEYVKAVLEKTALSVEIGGGIRTLNDMEYYIGLGAARVILGSVALENEQLTRAAAKTFGEKIAVGIDAYEGYAKANGWTQQSKVHYLELAKAVEQAGVKTIIYTDISKDGTLSGLNLEQLCQINHAVGCDIIASGGVSSLEDIKACRALGLYGVICGRALYNGSLDLKEALECAKE